jgi:hypothetical protein
MVIHSINFVDPREVVAVYDKKSDDQEIVVVIDKKKREEEIRQEILELSEKKRLAELDDIETKKRKKFEKKIFPIIENLTICFTFSLT